MKGLQHLLAVEDEPGTEDYACHEAEQQDPGPPPAVEGQLDVHAVEAGNQRCRHQEQRNEGEYLHYIVLIQVDDTHDGFL